MISVLIPVFNRDVTALVSALSRQMHDMNVQCEIILADDGSDVIYKEANRGLAHASCIQYYEFEQNKGRIAARQWLAAKANHPWLLFLDCDSTIISDQFLQTYLSSITGNTGVITGGRIYQTGIPENCDYMLHWKYGTSREALQAADRKHTNRFMSNNFLIKKNIFDRFDFTGGWQSYGYEDSWMAIQLDRAGVMVSFVNNPVFHDGLETSGVFLAKTCEALYNLGKLTRLASPRLLQKHVRLYDYYHQLHKFRLLWTVRCYYFLFKGSMLKNLQSCEPSLRKFDLYRLGYFSVLMGRR